MKAIYSFSALLSPCFSLVYTWYTPVFCKKNLLFSHRVFHLCSRLPLKGVAFPSLRKFLPSMRKYQQGVGVFKKRSERAERKGQHVRNA